MTSPDSTAADLLDATNPAVHAPAAITTPWLDAVCTGGLSIVVIAGLLIYDLAMPESVPVTGVIQISIGGLVLMQTLINSPHFIASYRLLYRKRQNLKQHQFVSIYLPIIMLTVIVACIWQSVQWPNSIPIMLPLEQLLAPLLLAWHYTGQAWGMTSCFAFLGGLKMTLSERTVIRCGLRALIAYHVLLWWNLANSALYLGLSPESAGDLMAAFADDCSRRGFRNLCRRADGPAAAVSKRAETHPAALLDAVACHVCVVRLCRSAPRALCVRAAADFPCPTVSDLSAPRRIEPASCSAPQDAHSRAAVLSGACRCWFSGL